MHLSLLVLKSFAESLPRGKEIYTIMGMFDKNKQ